MSTLILYGADFSPAVRACLLTLKALELPYEYKIVKLFAREQQTAAFLRMNALGQVPVLEDEGAFISDSHAICAYLVDKYGKDDALYPKDLVQRAVVQQRLYFESSLLFGAMRNIVRPLIRDNTTVVPKEKTQFIVDSYKALNSFLTDVPYVAGEQLTIADFACAMSVTSLKCLIGIDAVQFPNLIDWFNRIQQLPYYEEANAKGENDMADFIKSRATGHIFGTKPSILYFKQA